MKRLLGSIALALAVGASGAYAQDPGVLEDDTLDNGLLNNEIGENDNDAWENDNWASDDFGYYDEDFAWESDDDAFDSWYADADEDWNSFYDDVGDEGLFDV